MAQIISLPRYGNGVRPIFSGSPLNVAPVAGRLRMAGNNITKNRDAITRTVAIANKKAIQDAKEVNSFIDIKA